MPRVSSNGVSLAAREWPRDPGLEARRDPGANHCTILRGADPALQIALRSFLDRA